MNRRDFLTGATATLLTPHAGFALGDPFTCWNPPTFDKPVRPEKAVSLRRLCAEAAGGMRPHLGGLTWIDGYIVERKDEDVILYGRMDPKEPELNFDDLVVAIRSVRGEYNNKIGLISLDPKIEPGKNVRDSVIETHKKLSEAMRTGTQDNFRRYDALCRELENYSRIEGMPQDCQVAKTLLDADYRMKLVSVGAVKLPIKNPFKSQHDLQLDTIKAGIAATGNNGFYYFGDRNWFEPGRTSYIKDKDSMFLDCVQIVLKDEAFGAPDPAKTPERSFS